MKSICDVCGEKIEVGDSIYVSKDHKTVWCRHFWTASPAGAPVINEITEMIVLLEAAKKK